MESKISSINYYWKTKKYGHECQCVMLKAYTIGDLEEKKEAKGSQKVATCNAKKIILKKVRML